MEPILVTKATISGQVNTRLGLDSWKENYSVKELVHHTGQPILVLNWVTGFSSGSGSHYYKPNSHLIVKIHYSYDKLGNIKPKYSIGTVTWENSKEIISWEPLSCNGL